MARKKRIQTRVILSAIALVLFLALIVLLKTVDVAAIGPAGTSVGFSHINASVHNLTGENLTVYRITQILGYLTLLVAAGFAAYTLLQLLIYRDPRKVDKQLVALMALYVVTAAIYMLFEKAIVNYRPILMPDSDVPEASFPSSHTMLSVVIMGSAILMIKKYVKSSGPRIALTALCALVMAATVIGRLVSGVHWFTDILGGVFIGAALLMAFSAAFVWLRPKKRRRSENKPSAQRW